MRANPGVFCGRFPRIGNIFCAGEDVKHGTAPPATRVIEFIGLTIRVLMRWIYWEFPDGFLLGWVPFRMGLELFCANVSVRKGEAGKPSLLKRLHKGKLDHA